VILSKFTPISDLQILAIFDGYYMNLKDLDIIDILDNLKTFPYY